MSRRSSLTRECGWVAGGILLTMLSGCGPPSPAPVVSGTGAATAPITITVAHGQTLSGIAENYHVPMRVLAAANNLAPPYPIKAGARLVIPAGGAAPRALATGPQPPAEPGAPAAPPTPVAVAELPPPAPTPPPPPRRPAAAPPRANSQPTSLLPSRPSDPRPAAEAAPAFEHTQPPVAKPADAAQAPARPASAPATATQAKPAEAPKTAMAAPPAPAPAPRHGGKFLWPVRGHILEGFGAGPHGTHNDGLNIAAPRGAAVVAADSGVVAYAGNELRGYGNLVLIKHPNGWISAYAHCDLILVKKGEKVTKGQVIARVGSTGNVSRPQLHFELRRGDKPVDPREYLTPLPTAADRRSGAG